MIDLEGLRARKEERKAYRLDLSGRGELIADLRGCHIDIDALLAEVERAGSLLQAILHDDKLELTDGTMDRLGKYLGTGT